MFELIGVYFVNMEISRKFYWVMCVFWDINKWIVSKYSVIKCSKIVICVWYYWIDVFFYKVWVFLYCFRNWVKDYFCFFKFIVECSYNWYWVEYCIYCYVC